MNRPRVNHVPPDLEQRRAALNPAQSFIVQAPAGSGKTELLIRRYLVLLGTVDHPEEIIAITFTRKAAAEMRARVVKALREADSGESEVAALARAALANDRRHGWSLTQHPARLKIQTIDALCLGLARQLPWLSGFGGPVSIEDNPVDLFRAASRATLALIADHDQPAEWRRAIEIVLTHLDVDPERACEMLVELLQHRDQWLRLLQPAQGIARGDTVRQCWNAVFNRTLARARRVLDSMPELRTLIPLLNHASSCLAEEKSDSAVINWGTRNEWPATDADSLPAWQALTNAVLTKDRAWRRQCNKRSGFPGRDTAEKALRDDMVKLLRVMGERPVLHEALVEVQRLPAAPLREEQLTVLDALVQVLYIAAAELRVIFGARGTVDFAEIAQRANGALGSVEAPTELALRMDYRLRHLLVDEFQDTSYSQYELLRLLTAGWEPGDGRTLFLVGDPMQSIYRFREAEVGIFLDVWEGGLGALRPQQLTLRANFRSDPALVEWANATFHHVLPAVDDAQRGAVRHVPSEPVNAHMPHAAVTTHFLPDTGRRVEGERVAEIVTQVWQRDPDARIAVLARTRDHLRPALDAFAVSGIRYRGIDLKPLAEVPVVNDLHALTRALRHPADRMAWLAVLRAPWCGLPLGDLLALCESAADSALWDALSDQAWIDSLGADERARIRRFIGALEPILSGRGRGTLRARLEDAWIRLGGAACVDETGLADAMAYLDLVARYERGGELDESAEFLRAIGALWARPDFSADERLQVMSLHKAKGLEFDVVILMGMARAPRRGDGTFLFWEKMPSGDVLLAPGGPRHGERDDHARYISELHKDKDQHELARLAYVGCTRAISELHLVAGIKSSDAGEAQRPAAGTLLHSLWPAVGRELDTPDAVSTDATETAPREIMRLPVAWQAPAPPPSLQFPMAPPPVRDAIEFAWARETVRWIGILVHRFLQRLDSANFDTWNPARLDQQRDLWRRQLLAVGVPQEELAMAVERVTRAISHVLDDGRARWLFASTHRQAVNEFGLASDVSGRIQQVRIDRTFIDSEGTRWIVDYKTSDHEGAGLDDFLDNERERYREQLDNYADILGRMGPEPVRLALYFPLLRGWREWAAAPKG